MYPALATRPARPTDSLPGRSTVVHETGATYGAGDPTGTLLERPESVDAYLGFADGPTVDRLLKSLGGLGNQVRVRHLDAIRIMHDDRLFLELGYASFLVYCDRELGLPQSTAYEYVRVARKLDGLPRLRVLFRDGGLSWPQVRAITRVAMLESEMAWIEFALSEPVRTLMAEVRAVGRTGLHAPREREYGLPNLRTTMRFDLTVHQKRRVAAALSLVGEDGTAPPLVRLADAILSGAIPVSDLSKRPDPNGTAKDATPRQVIVYHACPYCGEAVVETPDGDVSVAPEHIVDIEPVSERVRITAEQERPGRALPPGEKDAPNTPEIARTVLLRDGGVCANPGCGRRKNLHAHHVIHRADGGPTELWNLITVCDLCHAAIHEGLLDVSGSKVTGLVWQPRPASPMAKLRQVDDLRETLRKLESSLGDGCRPSTGAPAPPDAADPHGPDDLAEKAEDASPDTNGGEGP